MLWTQNVWPTDPDGTIKQAAYRCENGHQLDPSTTRQCPSCGVHDTVLKHSDEERQHFRCSKCGCSFTYPPRQDGV